jgi:hypothetical protein
MPECKVIDSNGSTETNITLPPGEVLADELDARNIFKERFCKWKNL